MNRKLFITMALVVVSLAGARTVLLTGRAANAGIAMGETKAIRTNARMETNLKDVYAVGRAFGSVRNSTDGLYWHTPPDTCCPHTSNCDIDDNGKIDLKDYYATCKNFGKTEPLPP